MQHMNTVAENVRGALDETSLSTVLRLWFFTSHAERAFYTSARRDDYRRRNGCDLLLVDML